MDITIAQVLTSNPDGHLIAFTSALGPGRGLWWHYNPPPGTGDRYAVEMDILDDVTLRDVEVLDDIEDGPDPYRLEWQDGRMIIQGRIDIQFDVDGKPSDVLIDVRGPTDNVVFTLDLPDLAVHQYRFARLAVARIGLADTNI